MPQFSFPRILSPPNSIHMWRNSLTWHNSCHVTPYNAPQHTATHRNTLQHTTPSCNTLQHTYIAWHTLTPWRDKLTWLNYCQGIPLVWHFKQIHHCNTLQTLQHTDCQYCQGIPCIQCDISSKFITATHCNTLQHTVCCKTLQHTATYCKHGNTLIVRGLHEYSLTYQEHSSLQHTATHCNTLQHTVCRNTLQHTFCQGTPWI